MAASSPASNQPDTMNLKATAAPALASNLSPSVFLPLRFVSMGVTSLIAGVVLLALRPDILATYHFNQYAISATHLIVLGFITSIVMGAMYQLVPVALETQLHSEPLARWQFVTHAVGVSGLVWTMWFWKLPWMIGFGGAVALDFALFVYNVTRTLQRVPRWNSIATGIASALAWLAWTGIAGVFVAASKLWTFTPFHPLAQAHAHAHAGVIGFFLMMLVSVSYKLVPMFTLSEIQSETRVRWSIRFLNLTLAALFLTMLLQSRWKLTAALLLGGALAVYGWEMMVILRARKRRVIDWGLRYYLTALALLVPLGILGVVLSWPGLPATLLTTQLENVYGFVAVIGVVTFTILGFLYKIVPFLVWYHAYSPSVGRHKVPSLGDLYSTPLQVAGYWLFSAGLVVTSTGAALSQARTVQLGCVILLASLGVFATNMAAILSHFFRPRLAPLNLPSIAVKRV